MQDQVSAFRESANFFIHDVSAFPLVLGRPETLVPGYAGQWCEEMTTLVRQAHPFVIVMGPQADAERHEDRRLRALWLKHNREPLVRRCRLLVYVEPDAAKRAGLSALAALAVKAFGVPVALTAGMDEALARGEQVLRAEAAQMAREGAREGARDSIAQ
ncbi:hypothetical protein [Cupriavidus basilensis]|uniref:hypothetical protein n=1 Tax=Cupriavidus basilensis TaxID=68895 RepID=UPI0007519F45|nr:hypothetical protein [Cupriavidus basilensis]